MKKVETPYIEIWKEDNILHCRFADNLDINLEIAKRSVQERITFSKNISYPCLIDVCGVKSITKEGRGYMSKEGANLIKAGGLLVNSALTRMLGNIFLTINKPKFLQKYLQTKRKLYNG